MAWGQPDLSPIFSLITSGIGFALFWVVLLSVSGFKKRFFLGFFWFVLVQAVQLSWLVSIEYHGIYILFVYGFLLVFLGIQFGGLAYFFPDKQPLTGKNILLIGSLWTLFEWSRLFIFCGFAWNPVGLSMTAFSPSSQLASVFGVFGLSFWVIVTNLLFLNVFLSKKWGKKFSLAMAFFIIPYLFGLGHLYYHDHHPLKGRKFYHVALIQTALRPDEKSFFFDSKRTFVSPYKQWKDILSYLKQGEKKALDLIVLPEYALPFSAYTMIYVYEDVEKVLKDTWGSAQDWSHLLIEPFAQMLGQGKEKKWYVNNLFWAKALSEHYGAEMALGLDDRDKKEEKNYNAAFYIHPKSLAIYRYEKRILLPLAEYLPFSFLKPLIAKFGIADFFSHGKEAKVFKGGCFLAFSICYEECFGHLMREGKKRGAELFVNMTNDAWYPSSRLPYKHFYHGKLRAIENGIPLVRACNTGITGAIDSLGRVVGTFGGANPEWEKGVFQISLDLYNFSTLYTFFGDALIVFVCLLSLFYALITRWDLKKYFYFSRSI